MAQAVKRPRTTGQVAFDLESQPGFLLRRAYQRVTSIFQETAPDGLTAPQFAALFKIREFGVVSQNRLGRAVAMDPATCQGVVQRLLAKGLVARATDPEDRRRALLSLTADGEAVVDRMLPAAQAVTEQLLSPLSKTERDTLTALLQKIS